MKYIKLFVLIFFIAVIYGAGILEIRTISPELLIVFAGVYCLTYKSFRDCLIVGIALGLIMSGLSGRGFVFSVLSVSYVAIICYSIPRVKHSLFQCVFIIFCYTLIFESVFYVGFAIKNISSLYSALVQIILPGAVYNALFAAVLYPVIKYAFRVKKKFLF